MKVKVLKKFIDKETKKAYDPKGKNNSVYEGSEDRVKEIANKGYVEKPKKSTKKTTKKEDA
ncbi:MULTISPECIES: hypothetical protein [unclassified Oceanobacillus]|uniref:hypothetical protein n=1 Tax=unclassified Oceanobacillus TaxID=2630292 RepID=UPI001BEAFE93|nr:MULTISPECIES: hypothetical protein [unclassified Oceanobacillus]MBT2600949.1 hypothetical protein [Oceanobacillus sp. ISL-74]MBT2653600.1 hypothetical protein [Oceanobacillus sp. ISL-73]